jgi:hypothetical protein
VSTFVVVHCQSELLQIIDTLGASGCLACSLNGRQQQSDKNSDDCDDNQELYQCKPTPLCHFTHANQTFMNAHITVGKNQEIFLTVAGTSNKRP